jgi:hypothetical protein
MATESFKHALVSAWDLLGRERILEVAPTLDSLEGWTNETLTGITMDGNEHICDEKYQDYLEFLEDFFCSTEASQNERKPQFDQVTCSMASVLRYHPKTVRIKCRSGSTPQSVTTLVGKHAAGDHVPVH